jgi:WD40 repeat protein
MKRAFTSLVATACVFALTGSALAAAPATAIAPENAGQVVELKRIGGPIVNSAAISPDGRLVAVATSLAIELRDATKLNTIVRTLEGGVAFRSVAFSPDGQLIAGGGKYGDVMLWQTADGKFVRKFEQRAQGEVHQLVFSPDGKLLTAQVSDFGGVMIVWDVATGKVKSQSDPLFFFRWVVSPDGQKLAATVDPDDQITIFSLKVEPLDSPSVGTENTYVMAFSPDGRLLASSAEDGKVKLWFVNGDGRLREFGEISTILSLSFSPDSRLLAAVSVTNEVAVWDTRSGRQLLYVQGRGGTSQVKVSLSFSGDNKLLLANPATGLRLWQVPGGRQLGSLALNIPPSGVAFGRDGETVVSVSGFPPNQAQVQRVADGRSVARLFLNGIYPLSSVPVALGPQQRLLALSSLALSSSDNGNFESDKDASLITIQDIRRQTRASFKLQDRIFSLAFSPDEQLLAAGGKQVYLVNTRDRRIVQTLEHAKDSVSSLAFSSDGQLIAAASLDGVIRLWQVANGRLVRELPKQEKAILAIAFSPDNALLATAGADQTVRLWRVADGKPAQTLKGHESIVGTVAFSPDGALLASGALDGAINLWQVSDGKLLKTLKGHTDNIMGVAFMKNGQLASVSSDGTTRLWGVK